jgi:hypothetical protein
MPLEDFVKDSLVDFAPHAPGAFRVVVVMLIEELYKDVLVAPLSVRLFKNYTAGTGEPYHLGELPFGWQNWILVQVRQRGLKIGGPYEMRAYDKSAPYELTNTLGTFQLTISRSSASHPSSSVRRYTLRDVYKFGFDCKQRDLSRSRHGFPLPDKTPQEKKDHLKRWLPSQTYQHPCGFTERFALEESHGKTYLMLPQVWLAGVGKEFPVDGVFVK